MNELIKVNYDGDKPTVSGRELHEALQVNSNYTTWFKRMCEYGFVEGKDYTSCFPNLESKNHGGHNRVDHLLTFDMTKNLCLIQRTAIGKKTRDYFIAVESAWNAPEQVMARALKLADKQLSQLRLVNSELTVQNQIMAPKAEYFDELVDRNLLTNFRETAKQLEIKEKAFVSYLLKHKYIYRDKRGRLMPYAQHVDNGLFEIKECFNEKTQWSGTQTLITPKGRETFRLLVVSAA